MKAISRTRGPNAELAEGIEHLQKANSKVERMLAKLGTPSDDSAFRDRLHTEQSQLTALVKHLMLLLRQSSQSHTSAQVFSRLSKAFDAEYSRFQNIQRKADQQQLQLLKQVRNNATAAGAARNDSITSTQFSEESDSKQELAQSLLPSQSVEFLHYDLSELEQRQTEIRHIEAEVAEVATMYRDLHQLVESQQHHIDVIEENITSTYEKVERGEEQLIEAESYQKRVRRRKCIMLVIGVGLLTFLILLIYMVSK